jgi:hypothetical protein
LQKELFTIQLASALFIAHKRYNANTTIASIISEA